MTRRTLAKTTKAGMAMRSIGVMLATAVLVATLGARPVAANDYPVGVGPHTGFAYCGYQPATYDLSYNEVSPQLDYITVSARMFASPVRVPGNVVSVGSSHLQKVAMHAVLFKHNPTTRAWEMQADRSPWWSLIVGTQPTDGSDAVSNNMYSTTLWTNDNMPDYRSPDGTPLRFTRFAISTPGDYAVLIQYYWFADAQAPSGYVHRWVDVYDDFASDAPSGYCHFKNRTSAVITIGGGF